MRVIAFACGSGAVLLGVACGGPAFTEAASPPDAAARDARTIDSSRDVVEVDVSTKDAEGEGSTGLEDVADVGAFDDALDAPQSIDAEPPPPHCGGQFACAPGVPVGWAGPFELLAGPKAAAPCSAHFIGPLYLGTGDLMAPAPTCGCQCGAPQGVTCSVPTVSFFGASMCSSAPCASVDLAPGACTRVDESNNCIVSVAGLSMSAPPSTASGGSCAPLATSAVPVETWGVNARACISATGSAPVDCPAGNVCAPLPGPPYGIGLCISHAGDVACPAVGYSTKQVYYGGIDDTRSCSSCACGGVTGATCAATFDVFSSQSMGGCSVGKITYRAPVTCAAVSASTSFLLTLSPTAGSCAAGTSVPMGAATPVRPTTFCCL